MKKGISKFLQYSTMGLTVPSYFVTMAPNNSINAEGNREHFLFFLMHLVDLKADCINKLKSSEYERKTVNLMNYGHKMCDVINQLSNTIETWKNNEKEGTEIGNLEEENRKKSDSIYGINNEIAIEVACLEGIKERADTCKIIVKTFLKDKELDNLIDKFLDTTNNWIKDENDLVPTKSIDASVSDIVKKLEIIRDNWEERADGFDIDDLNNLIRKFSVIGEDLVKSKNIIVSEIKKLDKKDKKELISIIVSINNIDKQIANKVTEKKIDRIKEQACRQKNEAKKIMKEIKREILSLYPEAAQPNAAKQRDRDLYNFIKDGINYYFIEY